MTLEKGALASESSKTLTKAEDEIDELSLIIYKQDLKIVRLMRALATSCPCKVASGSQLTARYLMKPFGNVGHLRTE